MRDTVFSCTRWTLTSDSDEVDTVVDELNTLLEGKSFKMRSDLRIGENVFQSLPTACREKEPFSYQLADEVYKDRLAHMTMLVLPLSPAPLLGRVRVPTIGTVVTIFPSSAVHIFVPKKNGVQRHFVYGLTPAP